MLEQIKGANGKIIMAALAGTTAGIIAGLLMAPKTGSSLREGLALSALQAKNRITNVLKEYIQSQQLPEAEQRKGTFPE